VLAKLVSDLVDRLLQRPPVGSHEHGGVDGGDGMPSHARRGHAHLGQQRFSGHDETGVGHTLPGDPPDDPLRLHETQLVEEGDQLLLGVAGVGPERGGDSYAEPEVDGQPDAGDGAAMTARPTVAVVERGVGGVETDLERQAVAGQRLEPPASYTLPHHRVGQHRGRQGLGGDPQPLVEIVVGFRRFDGAGVLG